MQLTFLGTRGEIEKRTRRHRMHTSLMVFYRDADVMIDCGLDWLGKFERLHPKLRAMAIERGIKVRIAYDGMKLEL
jgi:ribonuclease BN (tRNA processing enzyme)